MPKWEDIEQNPLFTQLSPENRLQVFDKWKTTALDAIKEADPESVNPVGISRFLAVNEHRRKFLAGETPQFDEKVAVREWAKNFTGRAGAQQQTLKDYTQLEEAQFRLRDAESNRQNAVNNETYVGEGAKILDDGVNTQKQGVDTAKSRFTPESLKQAQEAKEALDGKRKAAVLGSDLYTDPALVLDKEDYRNTVINSGASEEAKALALATFKEKKKKFLNDSLVKFANADVPLVPGMQTFQSWLEKRGKKFSGDFTDDDRKGAEEYLAEMKDRGWLRKMGSASLSGWVQGSGDTVGQAVGLAAMLTGDKGTAQFAGAITAAQQGASAVQGMEGDNSATGAKLAGDTLRLGASMAPAILPGAAVGSVVRGVGGSIRAAQTAAMGTAAIAAGAQTAGAQFPETYAALVAKGVPHKQAVATSRNAALLSGAATTALTAVGGPSGAEAILRQGGKQMLKRRLIDSLKAFGTGSGKELLEELPDEYFSQLVSARTIDPNKPVSQITDEYLVQVPDLAASIALLGGGAEAIQKFRETGAEDRVGNLNLVTPEEAEAQAEAKVAAEDTREEMSGTRLRRLAQQRQNELTWKRDGKAGDPDTIATSPRALSAEEESELDFLNRSLTEDNAQAIADNYGVKLKAPVNMTPQAKVVADDSEKIIEGLDAEGATETAETLEDQTEEFKEANVVETAPTQQASPDILGQALLDAGFTPEVATWTDEDFKRAKWEPVMIRQAKAVIAQHTNEVKPATNPTATTNDPATPPANPPPAPQTGAQTTVEVGSEAARSGEAGGAAQGVVEPGEPAADGTTPVEVDTPAAIQPAPEAVVTPDELAKQAAKVGAHVPKVTAPAARETNPPPIERRKIDSTFERILKRKSTIPLINGMFQVPYAVALKDPSLRPTNRDEQSLRYRTSTKGEVTGDFNSRDSRDTIIFDESLRGARARRASTAPQQVSPTAAINENAGTLAGVPASDPVDASKGSILPAAGSNIPETVKPSSGEKPAAKPKGKAPQKTLRPPRPLPPAQEAEFNRVAGKHSQDAWRFIQSGNKDEALKAIQRIRDAVPENSLWYQAAQADAARLEKEAQKEDTAAPTPTASEAEAQADQMTPEKGDEAFVKGGDSRITRRIDNIFTSEGKQMVLLQGLRDPLPLENITVDPKSEYRRRKQKKADALAKQVNDAVAAGVSIPKQTMDGSGLKVPDGWTEGGGFYHPPSTAGTPATTPELRAAEDTNVPYAKHLGLPTAPVFVEDAAAMLKAAMLKASESKALINSPLLRSVAKLLSKLDFSGIKLEVIADGRSKYAGSYNSETQTVMLNLRATTRGGLTLPGIVIHEVLHHFTMSKILNPVSAVEKAAAAQLEKLRAKVEQYAKQQGLDKKFDYEIGTVTEFVTHLLTRPDFVEFLDSIPASFTPRPAGVKFRSVLSDVARWVAQLVTNRPVGAGSMLEQALEAALVLVEAPQRVEAADANAAKKLFDEAISVFGTTQDIREAGYVLPDGTMLDFSGRHQMQDSYRKVGNEWKSRSGERDWQRGSRGVDHREVNQLESMVDGIGGTSAMIEFQRAGAMRVDSNGSIDLETAPTTAQVRAIKQIAELNDGELHVDVAAGDRKSSFEGNGTKIIGLIRRFFAGEEMGEHREVFTPNTNQDARFDELTASLPDVMTEADIAAFKRDEPEKYAELEKMRETVLKAGGWDTEGWHGSKSRPTVFDKAFAEREDNWSFSNLRSVADSYRAIELDSQKVWEAYEKSDGREREKLDEEFRDYENEDGNITRESIDDYVNQANGDMPMMWVEPLHKITGLPRSYFHSEDSPGAMIHAFLRLKNPVHRYFNGTADVKRTVTPDGAPDGYIDHGVMDTDMGSYNQYSTVYHVNDSNQIKSADPLSPGPKIPPSQWANPESNDIRYSLTSEDAELPLNDAVEKIAALYADPLDPDNWPDDVAEQYVESPLAQAIDEGDFIKAWDAAPADAKDDDVAADVAADITNLKAAYAAQTKYAAAYNKIWDTPIGRLLSPAERAEVNAAPDPAIAIANLRNQKVAALEVGIDAATKAANDYDIDAAEEWLNSDELVEAAKAPFVAKAKARAKATIKQVEATGRYVWNEGTEEFDAIDDEEVSVRYSKDTTDPIIDGLATSTEQQQAKERLRTIFDELSGVAVKDADGKIVKGVSSRAASQAVASLTKSDQVPNAAATWIGTREEFDEQFAGKLTPPPSNAEGFYHNGRPYIITDQITHRVKDQQNAKRNGTTVEVEAVKRLLKHEALVHGGWRSLSRHNRLQILGWARKNISDDQLAALRAKYPQGTTESDYQWGVRILEEFVANKVQALAEIPRSGPLAELWEMLKRIYRNLTGDYDADPTVKEVKLIAQCLRDSIKWPAPVEARGLKSGGEVRMSYAGESAIDNLPEERRQFMRDSLDAAKAMAAAGKTSEEIRAVTGWFPGKYDGKMRFEVPDAEAKLRGLPAIGKKRTLEEVLNHPALFEAYPILKQYEVWGADLPANSVASFNFQGYLNVDPRSEYFMFGGSRGTKIILHEVQHAIQKIEGFAEGGSPSQFKKEAAESKDLETLRKAVANMRSLRRTAEFQFSGDIDAAARFLVGAPYKQKFSKKEIALTKKLTRKGLDEWDADLLKQKVEGAKHEPIAKYKRLAGEIEARDVEARFNFTPEQRAAIAPYSSENIAKEDAVVTFDGGKVQYKRESALPAVPEEEGGRLPPSTWESLEKVGYRPDAAEKTQITTTGGTYVRLLDKWAAKGMEVLDYAAGRGFGTEEAKKMGKEKGFSVVGYEPFSNPETRAVAPEYEGLGASRAIPNNSKDVVIVNAVINVVPDATAREIIEDAYSKVKVGGSMFINVMGWNNIKGRLNNPKTRLVGPREVITERGTFQKGYKPDTLKALIESTLPGATLEKTDYGDIGFRVIKNEATSVAESYQPNPLSPSHPSPLARELAAASQRVREMLTPTPRKVDLQAAYRSAMLGKSSIYVTMDELFAAARKLQPQLTAQQFGQQVQNAYEDGVVAIQTAESPAEALRNLNAYNVSDAAGLPGAYVTVLPTEEVRYSLAPESAQAYARARFKDATAVGEDKDSEQALIRNKGKLLPQHKFQSQTWDNRLHVISNIIDTLVKDHGIKLTDLPLILNSTEDLEGFGIAAQPDMQQIALIVVAEKLQGEANRTSGTASTKFNEAAITALELYQVLREKAGRVLGTGALIHLDERFQHMFVVAQTQKQVRERQKEATDENFGTDVPKDIRDAAKKAQEDEAKRLAEFVKNFEHFEETAREAAIAGFDVALQDKVRQFFKKTDRIAALLAEKAKRGNPVKASFSSEAAAGNFGKLSDSDLDALLAQEQAETNTLAKEIFGEIRKKGTTAVRRKKTAEEKAATAEKRKATQAEKSAARKEVRDAEKAIERATNLYQSILAITDPRTYTDLDQLLGIGEVGMHDEFVDAVAKAVASKAKGLVTPAKQASALNDLKSRLADILGSNLTGEKPDPVQETLNQKLIRVFGSGLTNTEDLREAWEAAGPKVVEMLQDLKAEELGIAQAKQAAKDARQRAEDIENSGSDSQKENVLPGLIAAAEQLEATLEAKQKELKANLPASEATKNELMQTQAPSAYNKSKGRAAVREILRGTASFDSTAAILKKPADARRLVVERFQQAARGALDPSAMASAVSHVMETFDAMVADLKTQATSADKAKDAAKRRTDLLQRMREEGFSSDLQDKLEQLLNTVRLEGKVSWDKIFKTSATNQAARKQAMFDAIKADPALAGLTPEQQQQLTDLLEGTWTAAYNKNVKRIIQSKMNQRTHLTPKAKEMFKDALPKFIEAINNGSFTDELVFATLAEKFGVRDMTPADKAKLAKMAQELQGDMPAYERARKGQEMTEFMQKFTHLPMAKILADYWTASVLSGPRTVFAIATAVLNGAFEVLGHSFIQIVKNPLKAENWQIVGKSISEYLKAYPREFYNAWQYVMTGDRSLVSGSVSQYAAFLNDGIGSVSSTGYTLSKSDNPFVARLGRAMYFFEKLLTALDIATSQTTKWGALPLAYAVNTKLYDAALIGTALDRTQARADVLERDFNNVEPTTPHDKARLASWTSQLMEERMRADGAHPDLGIALDDAAQAGRQAAMTLDPSGVGGMFYHAVRSIASTQEKKAAKWLTESREKLAHVRAEGKGEAMLPAQTQLALAYLREFFAHQILGAIGLKFARFGSNKLNQTLSFVPGIGALRAFEEGHNKGLGRQMIARNQMIGLFAAGAAYAILQAIGDDDDELILDGGWESLDRDETSQLMAQGRKRYSFSFMVDGKRHVISYANWPISGVLAAIGLLSDTKRYKPEQWSEKGAVNIFANGMWAAATVTMDAAALSQFAEILGRSSYSRDPVEAGINKFTKIASNWSGGFIPRILKDMDMWQDSQINRYQTGFERFAKEIPIYRRAVGTPMLDIFGKRVSSSRAMWSREYAQGTPEKEYQLLGALNSRGIFLSPANPDNRKVGRAGHKRDMTDSEKNYYITRVGEEYRQFILRYGDRLKHMPRERAEELIYDKTADIRELAAKRAYGKK